PKAEPYGGWDGGGRNLTGHIAGHHLSAVSLMWAATGDAQFKQRAAYIVRELAAVQHAHGDGYLCALEGGRKAFAALARGEIRSAAFDLNGEWSPWYTLHKMYAGLRDAYRHTGDQTALAVEIKFAAWAERVLSGLDDAQIQHMLNTEFGGMNEVMADLYADTGDERWLRLSYKFESRSQRSSPVSAYRSAITSFMPPNSVFSMCWICASSSPDSTRSAHAANLISTASAVVLPVWRYASRRPAYILCRVYQGDHSPFKSKAAERISPRARAANAFRPPSSAER